MPQKFCHHTNPAGVVCGGPPLKDRDYCYWHQEEAGRRMQAARARSRSERVVIKFPVLDDLHAVQVGVMQVSEAIIHGELDHRSGQLLLSLLRLAASNLKSDRGWHQKSEFDAYGYEPRMMVANPNFESQYDLPEDFDLSVDPEVAFPPPEVPCHPSEASDGSPAPRANDGVPPFEEFEWGANMTGFLRDAASAPRPAVSPETVEVYDVLEREGQPGVDKCLARRERNRKRRERKVRHLYYEQVAHNQSIKMAAERLAEEQRKTEAAGPKPTLSVSVQGDVVTQLSGERKPPESERAAAEENEVVAGTGV